MTHNQLQYRCFTSVWNQHPQIRGLIHGNLNNLTHEGENARFQVAKLKSLGHCLPGRWDMEFYWKGCLYIFEFKVGNDKLSKKQLEYQKVIEAHGGKGFEIRTVERFENIFNEILKK